MGFLLCMRFGDRNVFAYIEFKFYPRDVGWLVSSLVLLPLLIPPPFPLPERILYLKIQHTKYHLTMNVTGDDGLCPLAYALESHGKFTQY